MPCRANSQPAAALAAVLLTFSVAWPTALAARDRNGSDSADTSAPQLSVHVYGFPQLSPRLLKAAELEAVRMLRNVPVDLKWIDCVSQASARCMSDLAPTDLVVRVIAKALPQAGADALGIAGSSEQGGAAFVFYDRVVTFRTHARRLSSILGLVLAHEITHLLLPTESHSDFGLMRAKWSADDLRTESSICMGLPVASIRLMQKEALRRVAAARSFVPK
jgi:hypothetical protein